MAARHGRPAGPVPAREIDRAGRLRAAPDDEADFRQAFPELFPLAFRVAWRIVGNVTAAEDGKTIVYTSDDNGRNTPSDPVVAGTGAFVSGADMGPRSAIFVMNADGSGALGLTRYTDADTSPAYRPR